MKKHMIRALVTRMPVIFAISSFAMAAQAGTVTPPPLPPGSNLVQLVVGMNPEELKRVKGAHQHSKFGNKNYTHDDTLDVNPGPKTPDKPKSK